MMLQKFLTVGNVVLSFNCLTSDRSPLLINQSVLWLPMCEQSVVNHDYHHLCKKPLYNILFTGNIYYKEYNHICFLLHKGGRFLWSGLRRSRNKQMSYSGTSRSIATCTMYSCTSQMGRKKRAQQTNSRISLLEEYTVCVLFRINHLGIIPVSSKPS